MNDYNKIDSLGLQLNIREQLLAVEADRMNGTPDYQAWEVIAEGRAMLKNLASGIADE